MNKILLGCAKTMFGLVLLTPLVAVFIMMAKIWWSMALVIWGFW